MDIITTSLANNYGQNVADGTKFRFQNNYLAKNADCWDSLKESATYFRFVSRYFPLTRSDIKYNGVKK